MWKRDETVPVPTAVNPEQRTPGTPPVPGAPAPTTARVPSAPVAGGPPARLGPSLAFEGKLTGEEDLLVEGRFRGEIQVPAHEVTIGSNGRVEGEVRACAIVVEGEVRGNLTASEQVLVRASGQVHGDIRAPRVALDQGCRFKGTIDMEPNASKAPADLPERREPRRDREGARPATVVTAPAAS